MNLKTLLARAKRNLLKKPFLKDKRWGPYWFNDVLKNEAAFLVQIGSNDGKTGDPLFPLLEIHKHWKALFVEPIPETFQRLKSNYPDSSRFKCENVAINEGKKMTFYSVDESAKDNLPDLPFWFNQLGSFDKGHILKHFDGALEPYIIATELEGISLSDLLARNQVQQIDILHIDTEGYDWRILSQLDLSAFKPRFILFEHNHLSKEDRSAANEFLMANYHLFELGIDTLAVNKTINNTTIEEMKKYMQSIL